MIKQSAIVALGVGMGPLVQLVSTPWLARIYSPMEFGYFALFVASVAIFSTVACLRYEAVIPVIEEQEVRGATGVALCGVLLTTLLVIAMIYCGIPQKLYAPFVALGDAIWGIPVAGASAAIMLLIYLLTLRRGEFFINATMRSFQPILFVLLAVYFTEYGLLQAQIFSWIVMLVVGGIYIAKAGFSFSRPVMLEIALRFKQYPILLTPTSLLDAMALALPLLLIASAYGVDATGSYAQLQRMIGAPLLLGSAVMGQMFFKHSGELYRAGKSSISLMWKTVNFLVAIALFLLVMLFMAGEPVSHWLLGDGWRVDTVFLLLVTLPFACRAVVSPISTVFLTHHQVGIGVRWQVAYFLTTSVVLSAASIWLNFEMFLLVFGIHELLMYAIYLAMANRVARFGLHNFG